MKIWGQRFPISSHPRSHKGEKEAHDDLPRSESPPETTEPTREGRRERRGVLQKQCGDPATVFNYLIFNLNKRKY